MPENRFIPLLQRLLAQSDGSAAARAAVYARVRDEFGNVAERVGAPISVREANALVDELETAISAMERGYRPTVRRAATLPDPINLKPGASYRIKLGRRDNGPLAVASLVVIAIAAAAAILWVAP